MSTFDWFSKRKQEESDMPEVMFLEVRKLIIYYTNGHSTTVTAYNPSEVEFMKGTLEWFLSGETQYKRLEYLDGEVILKRDSISSMWVQKELKRLGE